MGDGASDVMSHAAATFCNQVPMFENSEASQRFRNSGFDIGVQKE
jgi:hypothetical protein